MVDIILSFGATGEMVSMPDFKELDSVYEQVDNDGGEEMRIADR
jgi:hypothetical protein